MAYLPPSSGDFTGFQLEVRQLPDGAWTVAAAWSAASNWGRLSGMVSHSFPGDSPEGARFEFRLRALPESHGARLSAPVEVRLEPRSAALVLRGASLADGFDIATSSRGSFEIARTAGVCAGVAEPVTTFSLPAGTTSWVDPDAGQFVDGAVYAYRIDTLLGGDRTNSWPATAFAAPRTPPGLLTAVAGGQVTLTVEARSRCPVYYDLSVTPTELGQYPATVARIAALPAAPSPPATYTVQSPGGAFYELSGARSGWDPSATFEGTSRVWLVAPADPAAMAAIWPGPVGLSAGTWLPDGALAAVHDAWPLGAGSGQALVVEPLAGAPLAVRLNTFVDTRSLALDAAGRPHLLSTWEAVSDLWLDGRDWKAEPLGNQPDAGGASLARGADGTLLAAWPAVGGVQVARWVGGAWSVEAQNMGNVDVLGLAGDADGQAHLLVGDASGGWFAHWYRTPAGWSQWAPPVSRAAGVALGSWSGGVVLAYETTDGAVWTSDLGAGGWGEPQQIGAAATLPYASGEVLMFAPSPDGSQLALADTNHARLWVRSAAGLRALRWHRPGPLGALGFSPSGKARLVAGRYAPTILFEEP
jgi:hypothetical protein